MILPLGHNPGGGRRLPLPPGVTGRALFGGGRNEYRYRAEYKFVDLLSPAEHDRKLLVIMMNPSVADEQTFDQTVAKCWRTSIRLGFYSMLIGNVFAYRATDQSVLGTVADPIGPENDCHLHEMAKTAELVVLAYGTPVIASLRSRGTEVALSLQKSGFALHTFGVSESGRPSHPLYLKEPLAPAAFAIAA